MNRVLKWVVWLVAVTAASFLVGLLMRFVPDSNSGPKTAIMALAVCCVVSMWFKKRGWW